MQEIWQKSLETICGQYISLLSQKPDTFHVPCVEHIGDTETCYYTTELTANGHIVLGVTVKFFYPLLCLCVYICLYICHVYMQT